MIYVHTCGPVNCCMVELAWCITLRWFAVLQLVMHGTSCNTWDQLMVLYLSLSCCWIGAFWSMHDEMMMIYQGITLACIYAPNAQPQAPHITSHPHSPTTYRLLCWVLEVNLNLDLKFTPSCLSYFIRWLGKDYTRKNTSAAMYTHRTHRTLPVIQTQTCVLVYALINPLTPDWVCVALV